MDLNPSWGWMLCPRGHYWFHALCPLVERYSWSYPAVVAIVLNYPAHFFLSLRSDKFSAGGTKCLQCVPMNPRNIFISVYLPALRVDSKWQYSLKFCNLSHWKCNLSCYLCLLRKQQQKVLFSSLTLTTSIYISYLVFRELGLFFPFQNPV